MGGAGVPRTHDLPQPVVYHESGRYVLPASGPIRSRKELTSIPRCRISQWTQQDNTWLRNIYQLSWIPPVTMPILWFYRGEKWDIHYTAHISPPQCRISYCQRALTNLTSDRASTSLPYGPPHIVLFNHLLPLQTTSHSSLLLLFLPPSC